MFSCSVVGKFTKRKISVISEVDLSPPLNARKIYVIGLAIVEQVGLQQTALRNFFPYQVLSFLPNVHIEINFTHLPCLRFHFQNMVIGNHL